MDILQFHDAGMLQLILTEILGLGTAAVSIWIEENKK